ncbi:MAG: NADH-quinone oxidoreductase subunit N [Planctomycetota bacterium]
MDWYTQLQGYLQTNLSDVGRILPEIIVASTFVVAMIVDFMQKKDAPKNIVALVCIFGVLASLFVLVAPAGIVYTNVHAYNGLLQLDQFSTFFKIFIGLATIIALVMAMDSWDLQRSPGGQGEYYYLLVAACFGGYLLTSASNLLMIYLSIETLSLTSYALAGYLQGSRKSAEAGMKYVIYGAMASGIMIFGMSYLFGLTGRMDLTGIAESLRHTVEQWRLNLPAVSDPKYAAAHIEYINRIAALSIMFLMLFAGFAYKISMAPFHFWAPDVYEGAPTVSTSFFSVGPKAAGFAVLIRVLMEFFILPDSRIFTDFSSIQILAGVAAVLTMSIGNLTALAQTNAKRMLAYSSIAHAGYMIALLTVPLETLQGGQVQSQLGPLLFYLIAYLFMNFGAFIVVLALEQKRGSSDLSAFGGAVKTDPGMTVAMCIFLFSLVGIPPMSGFIGKFFIFKQLADPAAGGGTSWHWLLIAFIGINSVISLFYYIRIARVMIADPVPSSATDTASLPVPINLKVMTYVFGAATLGMVLFCSAIMDRMFEIGRSILH